MSLEMVVQIIVIVIFIVLVSILFLRARKEKIPPASRDSLEVMKERYERGEITKEAYEDQKRKRGKD